MGSSAKYTAIVIILLVVAVGLGVMIFNQSPRPASTQTGGNETQQPSDKSSEQSAMEAELLDFTNDSPQRAEKISNAAQDAEFLDVSGCKPKPLVLKVADKGTFTAKNQDSAAHTINFDEAHTYTIPASGSLEITGDFGKGPGNYGYLCDAGTNIVGILLLVQ